MAADHRARAMPASVYSAERGHTPSLTGGGTTSNERLTAATGAVLIALLAVIGVTILLLRELLSVHMFVGLLLIGPVLLKIASVGYRFVRYYTNDAAYRRKGPPPALLRLIAPMVLLSTLVVFATGVALLLIGPSSRHTLLPIHKVSFFVWIAFTVLHVLAHLLELPALLRADYQRPTQLSNTSGRAGRLLALASALVLGVVLAILLLPDFAVWLHGSDIFGTGG